jgi:hypothetical protein
MAYVLLVQRFKVNSSAATIRWHATWTRRRDHVESRPRCGIHVCENYTR